MEASCTQEYLLGDKLRTANLQKTTYFFKDTNGLPDASEWLRCAVFLSFDMEWYSECRKELGPSSTTELGFAAIYGEDIIKFEHCPNASPEDPLDIRAAHIRVTERCHLIIQLNGGTDNTEEEVLFGTT